MSWSKAQARTNAKWLTDQATSIFFGIFRLVNLTYFDSYEFYFDNSIHTWVFNVVVVPCIVLLQISRILGRLIFP